LPPDAIESPTAIVTLLDPSDVDDDPVMIETPPALPAEEFPVLMVTLPLSACKVVDRSDPSAFECPMTLAVSIVTAPLDPPPELPPDDKESRPPDEVASVLAPPEITTLPPSPLNAPE